VASSSIKNFITFTEVVVYWPLPSVKFHDIIFYASHPVVLCYLVVYFITV